MAANAPPRAPTPRRRGSAPGGAAAFYHPAIHHLLPATPPPNTLHRLSHWNFCGVQQNIIQTETKAKKRGRAASLALSSKTNSAALTDSWLAGCEGFQSARFLVWSAYPMASMIHNVVRSTSYVEKSSPPQAGRSETVRTAPKL